MKKLFLIFTICAFSLYSILLSYADVNNNTVNVMEGLPIATSLESTQNIKYINEYNNSLQAIIAEQSINLNTLNSVYYLGGYGGRFDGGSLKKSFEWDNSFQESAPLFKSDIYKDYYKLRTEKILQKYQTTEVFDYTVFTAAGRQQFDSYIKGTITDQRNMGQLTVLLQGKILDKLIELEPLKRKTLLDETLALGLPINSDINLDYLYQLFESRVRLQMFDQMAETNKEKLEKLSHKIGMVITADKSGNLLLQSKDLQSKGNIVQIINVLQEEEGYRGLNLLQELYGKKNYKLVFNEEKGSSYEIELEKAIDNITIDENGFVNLDLNSLFEEKPQIGANPISEDPTASNVDENSLKQLERLYLNKTKAAQEIVKELNRYSIYLELENQNITNLYTRGFEAGLKTWKKNMDNKLSSFGVGGMADFMTYIKQFELLDRSLNKQDKERALIAKFRNSDIQFRTTEEGSIWIINMLYKIRYLK